MQAAVKVLLGWFAFFGLGVGGWQLLAPASFYSDFPGLGRSWVSGDGPYNEHLMRDVGQGNVAIGVVALVALLAGGVWLARATGLAATVAYLPHQLYHQNHLDLLPDAVDRVLQTVTLSLVSVTAVVLTLLAFRLPSPGSRDPADRAPEAATGRRR
ncbi:MAG TPA: hypothetical protein VHF92_08665 [Geodermatophilus sp.]|nr:hypothetical protein [Geodermatophilus sp.]